MLKSKLRLLGVSALVGAGLIAAGSAEAANFRLGDVDIQVDTTMSVGATFQMKDVNSKFLPETNGGPVENNPNFDFVRDEVAISIMTKRCWMQMPEPKIFEQGRGHSRRGFGDHWRF